MTIKQLIYLVTVTDSAFNISSAAEKLFTSQPGISKQIRLLETNIGCDIFIRNGKSLQGLTERGRKIIAQARVVISEYEYLQTLIKEEQPQNRKHFRIATTATQSAFVLPSILQAFHQLYPAIQVDLQDGNFEQLSSIAKNRQADCIIVSGLQNTIPQEAFPNMLFIPCYEWYQTLVCLKDNPLAKRHKITLNDIAQQAIITYPSAKNHPGALETGFREQGLSPHFLTTSSDPNTIKNYAVSGMGVGILAPMAFDAKTDNKLTAISLQGLIPRNTTMIAIERQQIVKPHVYRFIRLFAPHLSHNTIEQIINNEQGSTLNLSLPSQDVGSWVI